MKKISLLVGTKKGAFIVSSKDFRETWKVSDPILLGNMINHIVPDPRNKKLILMAATTGHLGPTIFRSVDSGKNWMDAKQPPAFPKIDRKKVKKGGKVVKSVFWLTPGHSSEPLVWYAGTIPQGLFITRDGGITWNSFDKFNNYPEAQKWMDNEGTPAGPILHSINVDPRDKNHICLALSLGGFIETYDGGESWKPQNKGVSADFLPNPFPEYGHCVHNMQLSPVNPDIIYQQGHCGIYRLDQNEEQWNRIGGNIPKEIGDFGFPLLLHPQDPNTLWVFPMDGSDVWPRVCVGGKPALYKSSNGGKSWTRQDRGFPTKNAWISVLRQSLAHDLQDPLGLYMGTTHGEIWSSNNEGENWQNIVRHLPPITSVEVLIEE